jgi:hypothetical protein
LQSDEDKLGWQLSHLQNDNKDKDLQYFTVSKDFEGMTYRKLFIKMMFEDMI